MAVLDAKHPGFSADFRYGVGHGDGHGWNGIKLGMQPQDHTDMKTNPLTGKPCLKHKGSGIMMGGEANLNGMRLQMR